MSSSRIFQVLAGIALTVGIFVVSAHPAFAASYTWNGRTFNTLSEMTSYVEAYLVVWRDLHGGTAAAEATTTSATIKTLSQKKSDASVDISTGYARSIEDVRATVQGNLNLNREDYAFVWFEYSIYPSAGFAQTVKIEHTDENDDDFDARLLNLTPSTTYYYRAVAEDSLGRKSYGSIRSFTTAVQEENADAQIRASTYYATDVEDDRATLKGYISWRKTDYAYVWFRYGESEDGMDRHTAVLLLTPKDNRQVAQVIRGLRPDQTYYFRLVAQDALGARYYGKAKHLTTRVHVTDYVPDVTTENATDVTYYAALLHGTVDMNDSRNGKVFFLYGEDRAEVAAVATRYERYVRIREQGDKLQKLLVDVDLDRNKSYATYAFYIDPKTTYYYTIGVEYEDENGDDRIKLGYVRSLRTKQTPSQ